jgi:hypothetical protein
MTATTSLTEADLRQFTGSECWYRHALVRDILFTDGAKYLADEAGAYWLLDEIALAQKFNARVTAEAFQLWTLTVKPDETATLTCEDGNGKPVFAKAIAWTDFPLTEITLYYTDRTILLPSEY